MRQAATEVMLHTSAVPEETGIQPAQPAPVPLGLFSLQSHQDQAVTAVGDRHHNTYLFCVVLCLALYVMAVAVNVILVEQQKS